MLPFKSNLIPNLITPQILMHKYLLLMLLYVFFNSLSPLQHNIPLLFLSNSNGNNLKYHE